MHGTWWCKLWAEIRKSVREYFCSCLAPILDEWLLGQTDGLQIVVIVHKIASWLSPNLLSWIVGLLSNPVTIVAWLIFSPLGTGLALASTKWELPSWSTEIVSGTAALTLSFACSWHASTSPFPVWHGAEPLFWITSLVWPVWKGFQHPTFLSISLESVRSTEPYRH